LTLPFLYELTLALLVLTCLTVHVRTTLDALRCYRAACVGGGAPHAFAWAQLRTELALLVAQAFSLTVSAWRVFDHDPVLRHAWVTYHAFGALRTCISATIAAAAYLNMRDYRRIRRNEL
jgi:hypothetical protein